MWKPGRLTTLCASTACYRDRFAFLPFTYLFALDDGSWTEICNVSKQTELTDIIMYFKKKAEAIPVKGREGIGL
jgi:hypothetical protein